MASSLLPQKGWEKNLDSCNRSEEIVELRFLPPEIWEIILYNLQKPKDMQSCANVCQQWDALLKKMQQYYTFSLVLPNLYRYLSKDDVIKCCQVSSSWNKAVDDSISKWGKTDETTIGNRRKFRLDLYSDNVFPDVHNEILDLPGSPPVILLLHRIVRLNLTQNVPIEGMKQYLIQYGKLICHLTIQPDIDCTRETEPTLNFIVGKLNEWLQLTPNVRSLKLELDVRWPRDWMYVQHTRQALEQMSLPQLPHLNRLNFDSFTAPCVGSMLLYRYGAQLEELNFRHLFVRNPQPIQYMPLPTDLPLGRLQKITLRLYYYEQVGNWTRFFESHKLNLKKMKIQCVIDDTLEWAEQIVKIVNLNSDLEELQVEYEDEWDGDVPDLHDKFGGLTGIKLEKLKSMNFCYVGLPSFEQLAQMAPKLQKLKLRYAWDGTSNSLLYQTLYEQPIFWESLPFIKFVHVTLLGRQKYKAFIYSREMFDFLMAKKEVHEVV